MILLQIKRLVLVDYIYENVGTPLSLDEFNEAVAYGLVVEIFLTPTQSIFVNTNHVVSYEIGE